jgi:AcrR family transcriptional regulator
MSPQPSNRSVLVEGALRCLERLPPERVTVRAIAAESGANLASIAYHFGSKDELVTEAAILGLDRWLDDIEARLSGLESVPAGDRLRRAVAAMEATGTGREGVARTFVACLARAPHDERVRELLAGGFARTRPELARVLGFGSGRGAEDAAGLVLSLFHGLLLQRALSPDLAIEGARMDAALARLGDALPHSGRAR